MRGHRAWLLINDSRVLLSKIKSIKRNMKKKMKKLVLVCLVVLVIVYFLYEPTTSTGPISLPLLHYQLSKSLHRPDGSSLYIEEDNLTQDYLMPMAVLHEPQVDPAALAGLKVILVWKEFFGKKHAEFGLGREPFLQARCPESRCWLTGNRAVLGYPQPPHALIWHAFDDDNTFPEHRSPATRYIFFSMESPQILTRFEIDLTPYTSTFNWTFTYRMDSDVVLPYGQIMKLRERNPVWADIDFAAGKTKMVAWFASNCHTASKREIQVKELQKYVPVDAYGKCGPLRCGSSRTWSCYQMLSEDYKFYLAFENSLCLDYVTEKVYNILELNVIPVVYGGVDYKRHLPPNSYIDMLDFPNMETLAAHLSYLHSNNTAYNNYFKWKQQYTLITRWAVRARAWCSLCERLHKDSVPKTYPDLHKWYMEGSRCKTVGD